MSGKKKRKKANTRNWQLIGEWATLAANIGVLISLMLVIVELNQTEHQIRAQTRHEVSQELVELLMRTVTSKQLIDLDYKAQSGGELTPAEADQYRLYSFAQFRYWEDVDYQYRMGLYDNAEFTRQRNTWLGLLRTDALLRKNWCNWQLNLSEDFLADMNAQLDPGTCAPATAVNGK